MKRKRDDPVERVTTAAADPAADRSPDGGFWLFSARIDLSAFLGSALVSLLLLAIGGMLGLLHADTPEWAWVPFVLLIDVAHVYATAFRVYFDPAELRRRPWLYAGVPLVALILGVALYSEGEWLFWRVLAYLAVFHFVRQQYGWVALYRARRGEPAGGGRWLDSLAIYAATLYPLLYWHAHLPRRFWWFLEDDFGRLPLAVFTVARPLYWIVMSAYAVRAAWCWYGGRPNPGKDIVVASTAVCWYVGIITFNSDYAFTVTNVIIHGVPYLVLVYWYLRAQGAGGSWQPRSGWATLGLFVATIWVLAYAEELLWDRMVWQERGWLFGSPVEIGWTARSIVVPLLALPQLTHYILDGFIWRRQGNPRFSLVRAARSTGA